MHISEYLDMEELKQAIDNKLVNARFSVDGQVIYNYSNAAMYTPGAWDIDVVRKCRGLIIGPYGYVVARPWQKFYNYGQAEAGELRMEAPVEVTDKADGSMAVFHYDQMCQPRVASRGSFESEQAYHATKLLWTKYPDVQWDGRYITPLAEVIYPENRIVCDYGDTDDLVLLGGVNVETGDYYGPNETASIIGWTGPVTETFKYKTLHEALLAPPREGKEGMCVRYLDQPHIVKIKQEDYLRAHAFLTNCTPKMIWERIGKGSSLEDLLSEAPDEFLPLVTELYLGIEGDMQRIESRCEEQFQDILTLAGPQPDRKTFAEAVKGKQDTAAMFMLLDGKDLRPYSWKIAKPEKDGPYGV